jgi:hypothetical protein
LYAFSTRATPAPAPLPSAFAFRACALFFLAACAGGCATSAPERDTAGAIVAAPPDQTRAALVAVLERQGYPVRRDAADRPLQTAYRKELGGLWDWLLHTRFGVGRSRVEAQVTAEGTDRTTVRVQVLYESKKWLWDPWRPASPPLQYSAANEIRLLRNELGLLDVQVTSESSPSSSPNRSAMR